MGQPSEEQISFLARGVVGAMLAVSQVRKSVLGDVWEAESAEVVVRSFASSYAESTIQRVILDRALESWPSMLEMLVYDGDVPDSLAEVMFGVTAADDALSPEDRSDYTFIVRNVAYATAGATAEDGLLEAGGDHYSDDERRVLDDIDAICGPA